MTVFIAGGAGFIGSRLAHRLTSTGYKVVVYDNFTSGRSWHLEGIPDALITLVRDEIKNLSALTAAMKGCDRVFHFASNPDIAKAMKDPTVDFYEGTYLTQNVLEAMRQNGIKNLFYASGSGVYGDTGTTPVFEDYSPLLPISTYGASKLAGEVLICSYCHMFEMQAYAFRFANVVGPRQTHGVTYDFVLRLLEDPSHLRILGDGTQSKSYVHVDDVLDAMLMFLNQANSMGFHYFNVATEDYVTVKEIADLVIKRLKLKNVRYDFSGGSRGWKGDVPIVRFDTSKIRSLGWSSRRTSIEALGDSIESVIDMAKTGKLTSQES